MRDEGERMTLLAEVFRSLLEALGRAEEVAELAQSNGKVRGSGRRRLQARATAPPLRGSPPPCSSPVAGSRVTAWTPPKKRLRSRQRTTATPASSTRRSPSSSTPGSAWRVPSS